MTALSLSPKKAGMAALRDYGIVLSCIALFIALCFASDAFFTQTNLLNILDQWSGVGIAACGITLVLIVSGFDLSIGAIFALGGVVAAKLAMLLGVAPGLLAGCVAGLAVGGINGGLVTLGRINPFIATLATGTMVGGVSLAISAGFLVTVDKDGFDVLGRGQLLGLRYSIWMLVASLVITGLILHRSRFGRYIYAVGGNPEAARLSGIRVGLVQGTTYAVAGLTAAVAGVIAASRVSTGQADAGGFNFLFDVYSAVIVGGTSVSGGEGAIWRTAVGVLLLAMIRNGFNLLGISTVYQSILLGAIILAAVSLDVWSRARTTAS
jgi:ribose transport system permease protein